MADDHLSLKLGNGAVFVKTRLKQLEQWNEAWEADFRALPKALGETEEHYIGLVVTLPEGHPLVCLPLDTTPNVNDLADLLARAMGRPWTETARRPQRIALLNNPSWAELFPHLNQLGIEVSTQDELPKLEKVYQRFVRQIQKTRSIPLILYTPTPTDVHAAFPAITRWVKRYGHIEIGNNEGLGFIVRALDHGGVVFEDDKPCTLAEAMNALEEGLSRWFKEQVIE